jgi:uncharacterized SAM-binding protein YcdF (DUF218 family)
MGFAVTHLLGLLLQPATLLIVTAFIGMVLQRRRVGRALLVIGVGGLAAILALPIHYWVLAPLENRFPRPQTPSHVDGVIVLGGAVDPFLSADRGIPSLNGAAERMTELVALAHEYPEARLVFTGGIGAVLPGAESEARAARVLFTAMGIPPDRVMYEDGSRTTFENAVASMAMAGPLPGSVWLLVTSASHMPRAVGVFRAAGWPVIPWPVAYKSASTWWLSLTTPLPDRISDIDVALHEWAGLAAYRVTGRTATLFPEP